MNFYRPFAGVAAALHLAALSPVAAQAQAPTLTSLAPAANTRAAPRNAAVVATFNQSLTAGSTGALKVFSNQRGGLRGGGVAAVAGNALAFAPTAYDFRPGETVQYTVTTAAAGAGGALARPRVGQFTAAVGGTGQGGFGGFAELFVTNVQAVVAGDVDGDGDLDFVAANGGANAVHVVRNGGNVGSAGAAAFSVAQNVAMPITPVDVALADVDGDGDLDLLGACSATSTVSVRLNGGNSAGTNTGVFSGTQDVAVGATPRGVAVGDVDGDGDLDFVTANSQDNTVSVRLNGGPAPGVFGGGSEVRVANSPMAVALADVDGDGDLDVLTASYFGNAVSVRLNGGDATGSNTGGFSGTQEVAVGGACLNLAVGDVDNDGDLDVVVASYNRALAGVRLNGGDATGSNTGVFSGAQSVAVAGSPSSIALADVDADGDLDLLATVGGNAVSVRLNGGDATGRNAGTFSGGADVGIGGEGTDLVLADLDGDSDLDVLTANRNGTMSSLRLNGGSGPLAAAGRAAPPALAAYPNPATGRVQLQLPPGAPAAALLDALGRVVRTVPAHAAAPTLDVAGLAPGLYVLRAAGQVARLAVK